LGPFYSARSLRPQPFECGYHLLGVVLHHERDQVRDTLAPWLLTPADPQLKVLRAVVVADTVLVVDALFRQEGTTE
jgi:hypothetical protein